MRIINVRLFYWQLNQPTTLWEWLTVPINERVVVGYIYIRGNEVMHVR